LLTTLQPFLLLRVHLYPASWSSGPLLAGTFVSSGTMEDNQALNLKVAVVLVLRRHLQHCHSSSSSSSKLLLPQQQSSRPWRRQGGGDSSYNDVDVVHQRTCCCSSRRRWRGHRRHDDCFCSVGRASPYDCVVLSEKLTCGCSLFMRQSTKPTMVVKLTANSST